MSRAQSQPPLLRVAAVWGTTVLAVRHLTPGQALHIGDAPDALVARPQGTQVPEQPFSGVGNGWELDPRGATGGTLRLRGRDEAPEGLAKTGAPVPIVAGDYGLLQYGTFSLFFQFTEPVRIAVARPRFDWGLVSSFALSLCMIGGTMLALRSLTPQKSVEKPLELTSAAELAERLRITPPVEIPESGGGSQKKSEEPSGGGKKMAQAEGQLGKRGPATVTKISGARPGLGGVAEALSGSVGQQVQETLGSISSVAAALGGLNSDSLVMGSGSGTGLRGGGPGGGGDGPGGVPYGAGNLDTGGMGAGTGTGPGGRGLGNGSGSGNGMGNGSGDGTGGERKLAAKDAPAAGQGLSPGAIARVVTSRGGAFRACYETVAAGNPGLSGTVSVRFSISPTGDVQTASIAGSSLSNPRVEGCVLRQIKRLHFPSADKGSSATFPFVFKPSKR
jgi:TonB family protein